MFNPLKVALLTLIPLGLFAQMGGGLTGFGMMGQAMAGMGASGPVVAADGTIYTLRRGPRQMMGMTQMASSLELVAIDPANGSDRWKLPLSGYLLSQLVLAPDGTIFLTDSEPGMMFDFGKGMWGPATRGDSAQKSRLIIIATTPDSARIVNQVSIDVDMLSQPVVSSDGAGSYVVYVNTFDMGEPGAMMQSGNVSVERALFAFLPDGSIKFMVKLGQM